VKKLVEFCRRGPPAAEVKETVVSYEPYSGVFTSFETRY